MRLESLLLSRDAEVIRVLQPALEKLSIEVEVCHGVRSGHEIIRTEKFDAIIVDCDDLEGGRLVPTSQGCEATLQRFACWSSNLMDASEIAETERQLLPSRISTVYRWESWV
jgi:hypothetical protein